MKYLKPLILESKNIGDIYHFTSINSIFKMLEFSDFNLFTIMSYFSFTRNPEMFSPELTQDRLQTRIMLDGEKMSHQYKIEPYIDVADSVIRDYGEYEERIIKNEYEDKINITNYIKQIDILYNPKFKNDKYNFIFYNSFSDSSKEEEIISTHQKFIEKIKDILKNNHYPFKINLVSKFTNPKYQEKYIIEKLI